MITNARVLQPEFVPNDVRHRPAEMSHLSDTLRPIIEGEQATNSLLYGPSGAGKTCIARYTIQQLRENVIDLNFQYVNCWEDHTRFKTLLRVLDGVKNTSTIHRQSTPKDELLEQLREYDGPPYVVILDEADQLDDKSLLYDLYTIPGLTMVLIANREEDVFNTLDPRLSSRLKPCARIRFRRYDIDELVAILEDRVRWGLESHVIGERQLEAIANNAAGDARVAIGILRNAARATRQNNDDRITLDIIDDVVPEAKSEIRQKTTDKLTDHQQVLYELITNSGEIDAGDLYDAYRNVVTNPKTKRTMRNYLAKLEQYNLIVSTGKTKGRSYAPQG